MSTIAQRSAASAPRSRAARRGRRTARPRRRSSGGVVWIVVVARAARRGRRGQRRRAAAEPPARRARAASATELKSDIARLCARSSRARAATTRIERLAQGELGLVRGRARATRPTSSSRTVKTRRDEPPHRLLLGRLRARLRGHARARGLAPGRAGARVSGMAMRQHRETVVVPAGARHDLRPDRRAARDRRAGDDRLREPAAGRRTRDASRSRREGARTRPGQVYPHARRPLARLRLRRAQGRPAKAREAREAGASPGSASTRRSCATTRRAPVAAQVLGYAGLDNKGLEGLERSLDKALAGKPGQPDDRQGPVRPRDRRRRDEARDAGRGRPPDDRPPDPGEGRGGAARHGRAAGARRRRRRSCWTRAPARSSRWRSRRGFDANRFPTTRAGPRGATAPSPTPTSPARRSSSSRSRPRSQEKIVNADDAFTLPPSIQVADRMIHEAHTRGDASG